jgi:hypothetical protein
MHRAENKFYELFKMKMMSKQIFFLVNSLVRQNAVLAVSFAPEGYEVIVQEKTRTSAQNKRLWAMLSDISNQVEWHGRKLDSIQWKNFFSAVLLGQESVPNLDSTGFVVLGKATSKMSVSEMTEMQELMSAFGAERNVRWSDNQHD